MSSREIGLSSERQLSATSSHQDRAIREPELTAIIPYSPMHIWRLEKLGKFPARIRLGANRVGWSLAEVNAWLNERKAQRERRR